jgi:hypothetical protein
VHHSKIRCRLAAMGQNRKLPHRNGNGRFTSITGHNVGAFYVCCRRAYSAAHSIQSSWEYAALLGCRRGHRCPGQVCGTASPHPDQGLITAAPRQATSGPVS